MGEDVLASGDAERALSIFDQLFEMAPDNPAILSGRIRALVAAGQTDAAQAAIDALPADIKDAGIERAKAALALAQSAPQGEDTAGLAAEVAAHPDDHERRFALANAQTICSTSSPPSATGTRARRVSSCSSCSKSSA
jgi:putative thioredoxin